MCEPDMAHCQPLLTNELDLQSVLQVLVSLAADNHISVDHKVFNVYKYLKIH